MRRISEAETLQAAAVIVAAPRYMGAFAYALGIILPDAWRWFAPVEIWSGLAMAILEGWAIAYISRHWRIAQGNPRRVLLVMQIALLVLLPATATPYLFGAEVGLKSLEIMPVWLVWLWKLAVAGITPLVVLAVGYASGRKPAKSETVKRIEPAQAKPRAEENYTCQQCERIFGTQAALNAHMRSHK